MGMLDNAQVFPDAIPAHLATLHAEVQRRRAENAQLRQDLTAAQQRIAALEQEKQQLRTELNNLKQAPLSS